MKKIFCAASALLMIALTVVAGAAEFKIGSNETTVKVGMEVDITITADDISELSVDTGSFTVEWDNNFEFVSGSAQGIEGGEFFESTGIFAFAGDTTLEDGDVLLTFKLLALSEGSADVNVSTLTVYSAGDLVPVNDSVIAFTIESDASSQVLSSMPSSEMMSSEAALSSETISLQQSSGTQNPETGEEFSVFIAVITLFFATGAILVVKRIRSYTV